MFSLQTPLPGAGPLDLAAVKVQAGPGGSLGKIARNAAKPSRGDDSAEKAERRREAGRRRFALQEVAGRLVGHERVYRCCRYLANGNKFVEVVHSPSTGTAHYRCLETCGSVWLCPVCAAKIAEGRRKELADAVAATQAGGGAVVHVTYTVKHGRHDDLALLVDSFTQAYRKLTSYRGYKELRKEYEIFGSVRALEVTHSDENSWHPHYHVLLFLSHPITEAQRLELDMSLRNLWVVAAKKCGLSMNHHGLKVSTTKGAIGDYIAKYGRDPKGERVPWGPESELTRAHLKSARLSGSNTPWDLLRAHEDGDGRAAHLFREYAAVFKGRQQLVWSPHLRALLGLEDEAKDSALADAVPDDSAHLTWIDYADWMLVIRYRLRGELLAVASDGDADAVGAFLTGLRAMWLADRRRRGLEPPAPPPPPQQLHFFSAIA